MLNPKYCGSEITGIQMVKLVWNTHFLPLVMGRCYHWICAEEIMAHFWSPALGFCLCVKWGKWLWWPGFRQGSGFISVIIAMVLRVLQSCSWGFRLPMIFPACDRGKQEHCFPIMCSCLGFCFSCLPAQDRRTQEVTRKISLSWHRTKNSFSASHERHSQSDLIRGERWGQPGTKHLAASLHTCQQMWGNLQHKPHLPPPAV